MLRYTFIIALCAITSLCSAQIPKGYKEVEQVDNSILYIVEKDGKMGVYDTEGHVFTVEMKYDKLERMGEILPEFMLAWKDEKCGLLDPFGYEMVEPQFEEIGVFGELGQGFSLVKKNGLYGVLDESGTLLHGCKYDAIESYDAYVSGYAKAKRNGLWGILSYESEALKCKYETLGRFGELHPDWAMIESKGQIGFIDNTVTVVVPCQFNTVEAFGLIGTNLSMVSIKSKFGVINVEGFEVIPVEYDSLEKISDEVIKGMKKDQKFFFNLQGIEVEYED